MRKKYLAVVFCAVALALVACACAKKADTTPQYDKEGNLLEPERYGIVTSLAQYKGLTATEEIHTVTEEDVDSMMESQLKADQKEVEITDRPAQMGDIVNIDFAGTIDGVAFDGGTGNYDLELGSGSFIDGFEEQVVGMKPGETKDVICTFPENYGATELAGKEAVFKTTANSIVVYQIPELTDEWVQKYTGGKYTTIDEYRKGLFEIRSKTLADAETTAAKTELFTQVLDGSEYELNQTGVNYIYQEQVLEYQSYADQYGVDLEGLASLFGLTEKGLTNRMQNYANEYCKQRAIQDEICKIENIEVTDEDLVPLAEKYGITLEEFKEQYGAAAKRNVIEQKVIDLIYDNATINKVPVAE